MAKCKAIFLAGQGVVRSFPAPIDPDGFAVIAFQLNMWLTHSLDYLIFGGSV
jgi:hypothetical protein